MNIQQAKKRFPIGTQVKYFPLLKVKEYFHVGEICSEPWNLCGSTVVKVSGKAGGVCVEHLEVVADEN